MLAFKSKNYLKFHTNYERNCERHWNCQDCGFQGNSQNMLKTNIEEKHTEKEDTSISCTLCKDVFHSKWYFMNHVRDKHSEAKEICRHFQQGKCKFSEDDCWSSHKKSNYVSDNFECHTCKEVFSTKNCMMKHRKASQRTKQCNEFIKGACQKSDEHCWYMHTNQDFQQAHLNKNPPLNLNKHL